MSKYTTEVRFICENAAGLLESAGASQVDTVLENSWNNIFTSNVTFFDEAYRKVLCKKILKHYYFREIGFETVGLWKVFLNRKLEEIMPYYNQLYQSEKINYDPLHDVDYERTFTRNQGDTAKVTGSSNSTGNTVDHTSDITQYSASNQSKDLYSDTPQGAIDGLETGTYLTNARIIHGADASDTIRTGDRTSDSMAENTSTTDTTASTTEEYTERILGKHGGENYSDMLMKFRQTMLNIDMEVINEFSGLFMGLW